MNRRQATRYAVALPMILENGTGTTHDLSSTGVLFRTDQACTPGSLICFFIRLQDETDNGNRLACAGRVVRAVSTDEQWWVAVEFYVYQFVCGDQNFTSIQTIMEKANA